jgi:plasmid stabilization system protein ParE
LVGKKRPAAPDAITDEVAKALDVLRPAPEAGVLVTGASLSGLRRVFLERSDYHLYYRINVRRSRITVIALWHARRRPPRL